MEKTRSINLSKLEKMLKVLQEYGVTSYEEDNIKLTLDPTFYQQQKVKAAMDKEPAQSTRLAPVSYSEAEWLHAD